MDEWAAMDSPHALFLGQLKSVPDLYEMDDKCPCVLALNC